MSLPYDYARCHGRGWPECADCLRRTSPWRPDGGQTVMYQLNRDPGGCSAAIPKESTSGRG